jgi:hypothetical protein
MKEKFAQACCHVIQKRPETSWDNFLRDFGERFVPGYKVVSAVDLLMNAPLRNRKAIRATVRDVGYGPKADIGSLDDFIGAG